MHALMLKDKKYGHEMPEEEAMHDMMMKMPMPHKCPDKPDMPAYQCDFICIKEEGILCATLASEDGKSYCLTEWVNIDKIPHEEVMHYVNMGYHTMLQACKQVPEYHYYIADYLGSAEELAKNEYLIKLIPEKLFEGKQSFKMQEIPVNKDDFQKEMKQYYRSLYENPGRHEDAGY